MASTKERRETTGFRAGTLAERAGVSKDLLRYYERVGVLAKPQRAANGYRVYPPEALQRVLHIQRALRFGFRLEELKRVFAIRQRGAAPCRTMRQLAAEKLVDLDHRLAELQQLRDDLAAMIADWDERLAATPEGGFAGLLHAMPSGGMRPDSRIGGPKGKPSPIRARNGESG